MNAIMQQVRQFIRQPMPHGYPQVLIMRDGETMCAACARKEYKLISADTRHAGSWAAAGVDTHWEGAPLQCCECNGDIESAYGVNDECKHAI